MLNSGDLWAKIVETTERALRSGALQPIRTHFDFIEDGGVRFFVRVVANFARKQESPAANEKTRRWPNPFLPYEQALYVADASESHVCLLNKYNVVDHHLLIVTREFELQESPLTLMDFTALWRCMVEYDSLGFYNAGRLAGASQRHKHLQVVPLPLTPQSPEIPLAPLVEAAEFPDQIGRSPALPFRHALARFDPGARCSPAELGRISLQLYRDLMEAVGLGAASGGSRGAGAYNLLVTRRWMLLAPRTRESFQAISVNALGLAGTMLVRSETEMDTLREHGPMAALRHVTAPWDCGTDQPDD